MIQHLPALNATLNAVALCLLLIGHSYIRRGDVARHKRFMIGAYCVSIFFLVSYLTYRFLGEEKRFSGQGFIRPIYFTILISHVTLAATVPILATRTLYLALRGRFDQHRRIARITYVIWLYVSVTGILVYFLLFQIYGPVEVKTSE